jgi:pimeloyl-ACP methyl ester carboxylesterase
MKLVALVAAVVCVQCSFGSRAVSAGNGEPKSSAGPAEAYAPVVSGYGAKGPYGMKRLELENPLWRDEPISVFVPEGAEGPRPTLFFSHAYGATSWARGYAELMPHLASRGYLVVYVPYPTMGASIDERYDTLWQGFLAAVERHGSSMDLSRVGFVGHSFGGGATPAMAHRGLVEQGWGESGSFLFIMAPWYSHEITQAELRGFPASTRITIQVYDRDTVNDHRMAIDLYESIASDNKCFQVVRSHEHAGSEAVADHVLPGKNPCLGLKSWGVFRQIDALADSVFASSPEAAEIATCGSDEQVEMGQWNDGTRYPAIECPSEPTPAEPESHYQFPWSNAKNNPRIELGEHADPEPQGKWRSRLKERLGRD